MKRIKISVTTDTAGAATEYGDSVVGALYAVKWIDGDMADGVDATLTCEDDTLSIPLLVEANYNTDHMTYPRVAEALNTNASALTTYAMPLVYGMPKLVIANGGSVKTGGCVLYIVEL
jgi:hypothetical protein